jgi:hypothetical protein
MASDLLEYAGANDSFLQNITGDVAWVHAYGPETNLQSSQWKFPFFS